MWNQAKFRIILASGSRFFLGGIRKILEEVEDIEIVCEAFTLGEIELSITESEAAFLFLDNRILRVNTNRILNLLRGRDSSTRIILLDDKIEPDAPIHESIIKISREADSQELIAVIRTITGGRTEEATNINAEARDYELTKMELRVIELIADSHTNKHIANRFSISEKTVKAHLTSIFRKLGIQNRYQLQVMSYKTELIPKSGKNSPA